MCVVCCILPATAAGSNTVDVAMDEEGQVCDVPMHVCVLLSLLLPVTPNFLSHCKDLTSTFGAEPRLRDVIPLCALQSNFKIKALSHPAHLNS